MKMFKQILVYGGAFLFLCAMVAWSNIVNSRPTVPEWPLRVGSTVYVSSVCAADGFSALNIAFENGSKKDAINNLYQLFLVKGECVALSRTMKATVTRVNKPIRLATGEDVFAVALSLGPVTPTVYSFIIVIPKETSA